MLINRGRRVLAALLLSVVLLTTACTTKAPSRFDQVQQASTKQRSGQAVTKNATQGSKLNSFFPKGGDGYDRVYTQEKKGFSEANLKKAGKVVAQLTISDTSSIPGATKSKAFNKEIVKPLVGSSSTNSKIALLPNQTRLKPSI